jgi:hypothetical protein
MEQPNPTPNQPHFMAAFFRRAEGEKHLEQLRQVLAEAQQEMLWGRVI